jgi:hypothetical protein
MPYVFSRHTLGAGSHVGVVSLSWRIVGRAATAFAAVTSPEHSATNTTLNPLTPLDAVRGSAANRLAVAGLLVGRRYDA